MTPEIERVEAEADREYEVLSSPHLSAVVRSLRDDPNYVKCPRCWHYHTVLLNYEALCDRCCNVLLEAWPDHSITEAVRANWARCRAHFSRPVKAANE